MDLKDIKEFLKDSLKYIIVIILVIILIVYVVTVEQVVGPSMSNTLNSNDIVVLDKISYRFRKIKRFEVISFNYDDTKYLVKRVIGLPGEEVKYINNTLYINGQVIDEDFLKDTNTNDFSINNLGYEKIPEDMYLVLGDNRENSLDSRNKKVGLINKKDIMGRVFVRIWPITGIKIVK